MGNTAWLTRAALRVAGVALHWPYLIGAVAWTVFWEYGATFLGWLPVNASWELRTLIAVSGMAAVIIFRGWVLLTKLTVSFEKLSRVGLMKADGSRLYHERLADPQAVDGWLERLKSWVIQTQQVLNNDFGLHEGSKFAWQHSADPNWVRPPNCVNDLHANGRSQLHLCLAALDDLVARHSHA